MRNNTGFCYLVLLRFSFDKYLQQRKNNMKIEQDGKCSRKSTVAEFSATVMGASSRLPIPKILFKFTDKSWHTSDDFLAQMADRVPAPPLCYDSLVRPKEREKIMEGHIGCSRTLEQIELAALTHKSRVKRFWRVVRRVLRRSGGLQEKQVEEVVVQVKKLIHRRKMKEWREQYGIVQRGTVEYGNTKALVPFGPEVMRNLPNPFLSFIPPHDVRKYSADCLRRLQRVESKLQIVLRLRGGFKILTKDDRRDANLGMSLARTTVTGGTHSDSNAGISGSIHMNRNLTGLSARVQHQSMLEGVDVHELQQEIIDVVCDIIDDTYSKTPWYIAAKDKLRDIPKIRLLPGARIPASHIWWTSYPETFHVHTDTNTIPPAFVMCANPVKGGELCSLPPVGGFTVIDTKPGTILGGSWAQYPHCNAPVWQGERHSFVVYLDNRHMSSRYAVLIDE